jgi:hypothetical protein
MTPFQAKRAGNMKRAFLVFRGSLSRYRNIPYALGIVCLVLCATLIACLGGKGSGPHSSTSVTTGNPTGITIAFQKDSAPVSINGKIEIFAADQITIRGFSPNPLLSIDLVEAKSAELKATALASLPDSLWPESSMVGDSILEFNAVISSDSLGLILKGLSYRKGDSAFFDSGTRLAVAGSKAEFTAELTGLTEYVGVTDREKISNAWYYHLIILGTGFTAKGDDGVFTIPRLPTGQHEAFWILLPSENGHASTSDSVPILSLKGGLDTELDSLYLGPTQGLIKLPDSLKPK